MNKKIFTASLLVLALSCGRENTPADQSGPETHLLEACIAETKTELGEKTGNSYPNLWSAGDAISVNGIASEALASESEYAGTAKATFVINGILNAPYYYAYPAAAVSGYNSGSATITLPKVQEWSSTSYDPAAFIMTGIGSSVPLEFTPLVAVVKLTMPGTYTAKIASVMFESLGSEKVSGPFTTNFSGLTAASGASSRVNLFAPQEGVNFGSTAFIVIPAQTYASGMRFTIRATDGTFMTYGTSSSFTAQAGKVYPLTTKTYAPEAESIPAGMMIMSSNVRFATARDKSSNPDTGDRDWTNRKAAWCAMLNNYRPAVVGLQEAQKEQVKDIKAICSGYNHYGLGRKNGNDILEDGALGGLIGGTKASEESSTILYRTDLITLNSSGTIWHSNSPNSKGTYFPEMEDGVPQTSTWAILTYKPANQQFFLLNTHPSVYGAARYKEIALIRSTITSKNTGNLPVILTGDWNMTEDDTNMGPIVNNYHSARKYAWRTDYFETYHWWGTQARIIDHIYYNGVGNCLLFQTDRRKWSNSNHDVFISDHYPVLAVFDFATEEIPSPVADFDLPEHPVIGSTLTFTDRSYSAAGIASWSWMIDGTIYTSQNPQAVVNNKKVDITLTVVDRNGQRAKVTKTLNVSKMSEGATHEGYTNTDLFD